jgi:uncharacterized protein YkwD
MGSQAGAFRADSLGMKRSIVLVLGLALFGAGLGVPAAHASAQTDAIEVRLLEVINQGRAGRGRTAQVMHAGVRAKTQEHSAYQASIGDLTHDGFSTRMQTATPDPAESNGAPDDGFGPACENVAYFGGFGSMTNEQVAQKFYDMWFNSQGHQNCMFDSWDYGLNAAGVGVVQDSRGYWFATFESVRDSSPPTGAPTTPPPPPGPTWTRVEQSATNVSYVGTGWKSKGDKHASGRSYRQAVKPGNAVTFGFDGTAIRVIGLAQNGGGIADVRVDGAIVGQIDLYSAAKVYKKVVFEITDLSAGPHTVELVVTGTKRTTSKDEKIAVDAFDYLS